MFSYEPERKVKFSNLHYCTFHSTLNLDSFEWKFEVTATTVSIASNNFSRKLSNQTQKPQSIVLIRGVVLWISTSPSAAVSSPTDRSVLSRCFLFFDSYSKKITILLRRVTSQPNCWLNIAKRNRKPNS